MEMPKDFWDRVAREVAKAIVAEKQAKGMEPEEFAKAMDLQRQMQGLRRNDLQGQSALQISSTNAYQGSSI